MDGRSLPSDIILTILPPLPEEVALMRPRSVLFSLIPFNLFDPRAFELMMAKRITAIAYELMADERGHFPVLNVTSENSGGLDV